MFFGFNRSEKSRSVKFLKKITTKNPLKTEEKGIARMKFLTATLVQ